MTPYKGIQDSLGFWIPRPGFRIPDSRYRILEFTSKHFLDSGIRTPGTGFLNSQANIFWIPESGLRAQDS